MRRIHGGGPQHAEPASPAAIPDQALFAVTVAELAFGWHAAADEAGAAGLITRDALTAVTGADAVGLLRLTDGHRLTGQAPTDDAVAALARLQVGVVGGPGPEALRTDRLVMVDLSAASPRWSTFVARAVEYGMATVACLPLRTGRGSIGALVVYSHRRDGFPDGGVQATLVATHAALALHAVAEREHLRRALTNRDLIGQAKGILMTRCHCTAEQAFDQLATASQAANLKLVDVAAWLITEQQGRPRRDEEGFTHRDRETAFQA